MSSRFVSTGCSDCTTTGNRRLSGSSCAARRRLLLVVVCLLAGVPGSAAARDDDARLTLGQPYQQDNDVWLDFAVSGMFDDEVLDALHSSLPATVLFEWCIWQRRDGWLDRRVAGGTTYYRVFYDVLQNRYDVFDYRGRLAATSEDSRDIERAISSGPGVKLVSEQTLYSDRTYYVEAFAVIELLDEEEMRDFERWFTGSERDKHGLDPIGAISGRLSEIVGKRIGLGGKKITGKTRDFAGFGPESP